MATVGTLEITANGAPMTSATVKLPLNQLTLATGEELVELRAKGYAAGDEPGENSPPPTSMYGTLLWNETEQKWIDIAVNCPQSGANKICVWAIVKKASPRAIGDVTI